MTEKEKIIIEIEKSKLFIQNASCPNGHNLMDNIVKIHNMPSIKLIFTFDDIEDIIYLDPAYGSFNHISETKIPEGTIVEFYCSKCKVPLKVEGDFCPACNASRFRLLLPKGGYIEGCLRKGCIQHELKLVDVNEQFARLYKERMMF